MCENTDNECVFSSSLVLFQVRRERLSYPLEKDMFVASVGSVFLFSCSKICLHFCTRILS